MIPIKNNELDTEKTDQLSETHNGNNDSKEKLRLYTQRNQKWIKTYHPLKQKKVKLRQLKFVSGTMAVDDAALDGRKKGKESNGHPKRSGTISFDHHSSSPEWADESTVVTWLISIGIEIKRISSTQYFLKNRVCLFNNVLIFANRKRVEMGLMPFYISSILEF